MTPLAIATLPEFSLECYWTEKGEVQTSDTSGGVFPPVCKIRVCKKPGNFRRPCFYERKKSDILRGIVADDIATYLFWLEPYVVVGAIVAFSGHSQPMRTET